MKLANLPSAQSGTGNLNLHLVSLQAYVFRCPSLVPVRTSFGIMHERPAVFVRAQSDQGEVGWGEIWCNFPACGAEHRAALLSTVIAPLLLGKSFTDPAQAYAHATQKTEVLALQTGEPGPLAQVIAGVDLALWDLCARRAKLPLIRDRESDDRRSCLECVKLAGFGTAGTGGTKVTVLCQQASDVQITPVGVDPLSV